MYISTHFYQLKLDGLFRRFIKIQIANCSDIYPKDKMEKKTLRKKPDEKTA